uniref:Uncharacterized protein n=1 Tax=Avena sativa TaxID=4498 RepID=A0ACD5YVP0_AVESA
MGKQSVKGLSTPNQWAMLEESALQHDWLSNLPDDVLLNIIERLDVADAMRTSILSRRWKHIPCMLSKILIMVGFADNLKERTCDVARANATMLGATRSLLESRSTSPYTIHRLCMQFYLGDGYKAVAKTIATHKVAFAELTILTEKELKRCSPSYYRVAYGLQLKLFVLTCPDAFAFLAQLKLENLRLGESDFPVIFRLCKGLEFLRLDNYDMGDLSLLAVEHPRLRELEIVRSYFKRVDLNWLPELRTLTFSSWMSVHDPLSFCYIPLLHTVRLSNTALSSHKVLKLSEFLGKATVFSKLRIVNLAAISEECDLTWTVFVLQGAPSLEELCIRVCDCLGIWDEDQRKDLAYSEERKDLDAKWEASDFKHLKLSVLRIFGFQSKVKFVDYITTVMEAAVNLKNIYLHEKPACEEKCEYNRQRGDRFPKSRKQKILVPRLGARGAARELHPRRPAVVAGLRRHRHRLGRRGFFQPLRCRARSDDDDGEGDDEIVVKKEAVDPVVAATANLSSEYHKFLTRGNDEDAFTEQAIMASARDYETLWGDYQEVVQLTGPVAQINAQLPPLPPLSGWTPCIAPEVGMELAHLHHRMGPPAAWPGQMINPPVLA